MTGTSNQKGYISVDKVKNHFKKHKNKYLIGLGAVACVGVGYGLRPENSQVSISNPALINYRPSSNTVQVQMTRPGPKSFVVQCLEDGRV